MDLTQLAVARTLYQPSANCRRGHWHCDSVRQASVAGVGLRCKFFAAGRGRWLAFTAGLLCPQPHRRNANSAEKQRRGGAVYASKTDESAALQDFLGGLHEAMASLQRMAGMAGMATCLLRILRFLRLGCPVPQRHAGASAMEVPVVPLPYSRRVFASSWLVAITTGVAALHGQTMCAVLCFFVLFGTVPWR